MALIGNLRDFGLSEFLYLVDRGYKTGRLTLQKPGDRAELYFNRGQLVYATHTHQEDRLGDILIRQGLITPEQCQAALRYQRLHSPQTPLGAILIQYKLLTLEQVHRCVQQQVEEITFGLFGWHDGQFRFEPDLAPPPQSVTVTLSIENIIMEGTRRIDEWTRIRQRISSLDLFPNFTGSPHEKARGIQLSEQEWRIFARIDGAHNLRQIAHMTGTSEFETARVIYGFIEAGLVALSRQPAAPAPPAATATPVSTNSVAAVPAQADKVPAAPARSSGAGTVYEARPKKGIIRRLIAFFSGA